MAQTTPRTEDRHHRGLMVSLVIGIMLALGPLFGAMTSVFVMMHRTQLVRELVLRGESDGTVPFPVTPVVSGFALFPVGLLIVWLSVMRLSEHMTEQRRGRRFSSHI